MLTHLSIHGLAIIDELNIDFSRSFNVITGETGAGKSILIKALSLLLGAKASPEVVREGYEQALVTGKFEVPVGHAVCDPLTSLGIPFDADGGTIEIIIRRQVTAKSKGGAWINDTPLTVGSLKGIGILLIDIFSQHENQRLLDANQHVLFIDQFIEDHGIKEDVRGLFHQVHEQVKELTEWLERYARKDRDRDFLQFRLEELGQLDFDEGSYEKAQTLCREVQSILAKREDYQEALALLKGDAESGASPSESLWAAYRLLSSSAVARETEGELVELLGETANRLDDILYRMERTAAHFEVDEDAIAAAQELIAQYQKIMRKHSVGTLAELKAAADALREEQAFLDNFEMEVKERLKIISRNASSLLTVAGRLLQCREKAASLIKKRIEGELKELEMPGARLSVEFTPVQRHLPALDMTGLDHAVAETWRDAAEKLTQVGELGSERAQFLFSANKGEPLKPLQKIASGGEISRMMLAFKKVLAAEAETCVLVFDEIDAGISGRAADLVGKKMWELGKDYQIICISHLPQVACYADRHFLVEKSNRKGRTESRIVRLSAEDSLRELARLLSGTELSPQSLANARLLRQKARARANPPSVER